MLTGNVKFLKDEKIYSTDNERTDFNIEDIKIDLKSYVEFLGSFISGTNITIANEVLDNSYLNIDLIVNKYKEQKQDLYNKKKNLKLLEEKLMKEREWRNELDEVKFALQDELEEEKIKNSHYCKEIEQLKREIHNLKNTGNEMQELDNDLKLKLHFALTECNENARKIHELQNTMVVNEECYESTQMSHNCNTFSFSEKMGNLLTDECTFKINLSENSVNRETKIAEIIEIKIKEDLEEENKKLKNEQWELIEVMQVLVKTNLELERNRDQLREMIQEQKEKFDIMYESLVVLQDALRKADKDKYNTHIFKMKETIKNMKIQIAKSNKPSCIELCRQIVEKCSEKKGPFNFFPKMARD